MGRRTFGTLTRLWRHSSRLPGNSNAYLVINRYILHGFEIRMDSSTCSQKLWSFKDCNIIKKYIVRHQSSVVHNSWSITCNFQIVIQNANSNRFWALLWYTFLCISFIMSSHVRIRSCKRDLNTEKSAT